MRQPGTRPEYEVLVGTRVAVAGRALYSLVDRNAHAAIGTITCELPFPGALRSVRRTEARDSPHHVDVFYRTLEWCAALVAQQLTLAITLWLGEFHENDRAIRIVLLRRSGDRGRQIVGENRRQSRLLVVDRVTDLAHRRRIVVREAGRRPRTGALDGHRATGMPIVAMDFPRAVFTLPHQQVLPAPQLGVVGAKRSVGAGFDAQLTGTLEIPGRQRQRFHAGSQRALPELFDGLASFAHTVDARNAEPGIRGEKPCSSRGVALL